MKRRRRINYSLARRSENWIAGRPANRWARSDAGLTEILRCSSRWSCRPAASVRRTGSVLEQRLAFLNARRSLDGSAWAARAVDRAPHGPVSINHRPWSPGQWRSGSLPGCWVRSGGLGSGAASQALQAGLLSVLEADSVDQSAAEMVTGADCRLAAHISEEGSEAGVTRDDLSQPVPSGAAC